MAAFREMGNSAIVAGFAPATQVPGLAPGRREMLFGVEGC